MTDQDEILASQFREAFNDPAYQLSGHTQPQSVEALMAPVFGPTDNPRVEFMEGQLLFTMTTQAGARIERFISDAAAREAFSGIPIDSGWLRPEVARWGDGKHGEWAVAFFPPAVYGLEVTGEELTGDRRPETGEAETGEGGPTVANATNAGETPVVPVFKLERLNVPLPGLVWFGIGTNYYIYAVKTPTHQPYQEIYRAPLPNVYSNGGVCWGLVRPPRATARTLFDAFDLFMKSTFNNHLASAKSKSQKEDVRAVLRELANSQALIAPDNLASRLNYPVADLVRQVEGTGITLDSAIREFFQTGAMPG